MKTSLNLDGGERSAWHLSISINVHDEEPFGRMMAGLVIALSSKFIMGLN